MVIRLLVLIDRPIVRNGIRALFEATPDFVVVDQDLGHLAEPADTVSATMDVVLIDQQLRDRDGISAAAAIMERYAQDAPGVVMLADAPRPADIGRAALVGVRGYLLEDDETPQLVAGIRAVAAGHSWWSARATTHLLEEYRKNLVAELRQNDRDVSELTERERGVARLVALGQSNSEIAHELVLGRATVKSHVSRILTKLDLRDRTQLAAYAYRNGLVNSK